MVAAPAAAAAFLLAGVSVHATVAPSVATRDGQVRISVSGVSAPAVSARIDGGLASGGRWFNWVALRPGAGGTWWTVLRAPGYLGVYPVEIRAGRAVDRTDAVVQILPAGYTAEPGFVEPEQVAEWWTRIAPAAATLTGVSTWQAGFFTHRDPDLNRLLRVRFTIARAWPQLHLKPGERTMFLSVARLRAGGLWRLLEAVPAP
jgi:hypothetical protein